MKKRRKIWIGFGILVLIQIIYSFYYASEIVSQNDMMTKNRIKLEKLRLEGEKLSLETARIMSMESLKEKISILELMPITKEIK